MDRYKGPKWSAVFRLLAYSGIRQGEALALTWDDVEFEDNFVDINKALTRGINNSLIIQLPKSESSIREVSLDKETMDYLKRWKTEQKKYLFKNKLKNKKNLVFYSETTNSYMTSSQLRKKMHSIQDKVCLPRITVHGLRHTHCSLLFEAGVKMEVVKERLGHSDIQTTMNIYTHVTKKRKDEVAIQFASLLSI